MASGAGVDGGRGGDDAAGDGDVLREVQYRIARGEVAGGAETASAEAMARALAYVSRAGGWAKTVGALMCLEFADRFSSGKSACSAWGKLDPPAGMLLALPLYVYAEAVDTDGQLAVMGGAKFYLDDNAVLLEWVVTRSDWRRRGLLTRMLDAALPTAACGQYFWLQTTRACM